MPLFTLQMGDVTTLHEAKSKRHAERIARELASKIGKRTYGVWEHRLMKVV